MKAFARTALLVAVAAATWKLTWECRSVTRRQHLQLLKLSGYALPPGALDEEPPPPKLIRKDPLPVKEEPAHPLANLTIAEPDTTPRKADDWMTAQLEAWGVSIEVVGQVPNEGARIPPAWGRRRSSRVANQTAADVGDREVEVYDCSRPQNIEAVIPKKADDCRAKRNTLGSRNVSYVILQPAEFQRITVKSCRVSVSQFVFYCGAYDHATFMPQFSYLHRPKLIPQKECERYWDLLEKGEQLVVVSETSKDRQLLTLVRNGVLRYTNQVVGKSWTVPGYDAKCQGGKFTDGMGKEYTDVVASEYVELEMLERQATIDDKGVLTLELEERVLKGSMATGGCVASTGLCESLEMGTFLWKPAPDDGEVCPFYRSRPEVIHGREVTTTNEQGATTRVFVSTDGSMIRLILGKERIRCESQVIETDYAKVFVSADLDNEYFSRNLHSSEVSVTTYLNQQDGYIFGALGEHLNVAVNAALKASCEREVERQQLQFAEMAAADKARMDGETASIGNGRFATAAGEVWYTYECRKLVAQAMDKDECYSSLPVRLVGDDEARYMAQRGDLPPAGVEKLLMLDFFKQNNLSHWQALRATYNSTNSIQFFAEPSARRLTTMGIIRPCTDGFTAKYRNRNGNWIQAAPKIVLATPPRELVNPTLAEVDIPALPDLRMESGGIYNSRLVLEHERLLTNGRRGHDIVNRMSHRAFDYRHEWDSSPASAPASSLLDGLPGALGLGWVTTMWEWLSYWSQATSVAMSLYLAFRILGWLASLLFRVAAARGDLQLPDVAELVGGGAADGAAADAAAAAAARREWEQELQRARAANDEAERALRRREAELDALEERRAAAAATEGRQAGRGRMPFANDNVELWMARGNASMQGNASVWGELQPPVRRLGWAGQGGADDGLQPLALELDLATAAPPAYRHH